MTLRGRVFPRVFKHGKTNKGKDRAMQTVYRGGLHIKPPRYSPQHYRDRPVLKTSAYDDLVDETARLRVWVSKMTQDDGSPEEHHVTVEFFNGETWETVFYSRGNRWLPMP